MSPVRSRLVFGLTFAIGLAPALARADGAAIFAEQVESKSVKIDGVPKEWSLAPLTFNVRGKPDASDLQANATLGYDQTNLYVAVDVADDVFRAGGDHVTVLVGFPGGHLEEVQLYPGDPGKAPGAAKSRTGAPIAGAKVVEAPRQGGWSLEASVPWSAFPEARTLRVGMRGAIFVYDVDGGGAVKNVVGTAPTTTYASLPPIVTESELALGEGLMTQRSLTAPPKFNLMGDVTGDAFKERVLVFEHFLVVLGPTYRKGSEYYYTDVGADLLGCELRDVDGDGKADIVLRKRITSGSRHRDVLDIRSFGQGEIPVPIFEHEIGIGNENGSIANDVSFVADGGKVAVKITAGSARGLNAGNYHEPTESAYDPVLLPWGTIGSQTYKVSGGKYAKTSEETKPGTAAPAGTVAPGGAAPAEAALPKAQPPSASELLEKVYETYKHDRGVSGHPRFDIAADVAGDGAVERVLVHDRDIVIFGKGFKGGTGYTYLTLSQFASGNDILEFTARDVTGDGKAEIVVKGVLHASAPPDAGGGTVDREVVLVFTMAADALKRVFAVETARAIGGKRVAAQIQLGAGTIQVGSGRATGWTEQTYPFNQDTAPVGGYEPLPLPWTSTSNRYRWSGGAFVR